MLNTSFVSISPYLVAIVYIDDYNVHTYIYIIINRNRYNTNIHGLQYRLQNVTVNYNEQIHMEIYAI